MLEAVAAGRLPKLTFECAVEGRFRFVAHLAGDFRYTPRGILKRPRGQLKPPASQIRHGRLGQVPGEALDDYRMVLASLIERKLAHFSNDRRYIMSLDLARGARGPRLAVTSTWI